MGYRSQVFSTLLGMVGAVAGGVFGHVLFFWFVKQGFYPMVFPGAFVGIGCGSMARHVSKIRGVFCAIAGLGLGLFTEWTFRPFRADDGFFYFLRHVGDLTPVTLIMIALGAAIAFWFGKDAGLSLAGGGRTIHQNPPSDPADKLS